MRKRAVILTAAAVLSLAVIGCSSSDMNIYAHPVSILVTNAACQVEPCDSLMVLVFPSNAPNTPGGRWGFSIGTTTKKSECMVIPPTAKFTVSGPDDEWITWWDTTIPAALAGVDPNNTGWPHIPTTSSIRPDSATGWAVSFPSRVIAPHAQCM